MEINVYSKTQKMSAAEIRKIGQAVLKAGFGIEKLHRNFTGCSVIVIGAYYGLAVEAINELGYETDEDEIHNEES